MATQIHRKSHCERWYNRCDLILLCCFSSRIFFIRNTGNNDDSIKWPTMVVLNSRPRISFDYAATDKYLCDINICALMLLYCHSLFCVRQIIETFDANWARTRSTQLASFERSCEDWFGWFIGWLAKNQITPWNHEMNGNLNNLNADVKTSNFALTTFRLLFLVFFVVFFVSAFIFCWIWWNTKESERLLVSLNEPSILNLDKQHN